MKPMFGTFASGVLASVLSTFADALAAEAGILPAGPGERAVRVAGDAQKQLAAISDEVFWDGFNLCGNGIIDGSEQCDRQDLGGATCASVDASNPNGILACQRSCNFDTTGCLP